MTTIAPQNKGGANRKKDTYCRRFDCKKYRGVETQEENEAFCCCKINSRCNNKRHETSP